ncbi:7-carboxy-7-deazaguanine synthase QueE [Vicingaceae bacterium]|nr:7-carboxy-7-deazaguanine synthase QueE [Vicingaceae bacterium]MDB4061029.1 7-carboxy-7-deazaguanine synthase QueE [Vicingaceae bacterium]MDB9963731.1 7-carboxy-7-deazaguanine synthase QueE [Vicingaceae bacterium]MDC1451833.1 7-carboxy-7-deazaguanine synthase QueE [Vicingaceae bacterium]
MTELQTIEYPLMEAFYTLQGEGYYSGKAAYFIRLAGCDVGCHWCDVKESWDAGLHKLETTDNIVHLATENPSRFCVVTGGEPMMYDLATLTDQLIHKGFELAVETSGAYSLSGSWNWICLSPKKFKAPKEEFYEVANELKVIIFNQSDFKWAEEHAAKVNKNCKLYLQVEWSIREKLTSSLIEYVKQNPQWRISVQTHKYLNIP